MISSGKETAYKKNGTSTGQSNNVPPLFYLGNLTWTTHKNPSSRDRVDFLHLTRSLWEASTARIPKAARDRFQKELQCKIQRVLLSDQSTSTENMMGRHTLYGSRQAVRFYSSNNDVRVKVNLKLGISIMVGIGPRYKVWTHFTSQDKNNTKLNINKYNIRA